MRRLTTLVLVILLAIVLIPSNTFAAQRMDGIQRGKGHGKVLDNRKPNPLAEKQFKMRQKGLQKLIQSQASGNLSSMAHGKNKVVKLAKGQYVELAREDTDHIFTILVEFGGSEGPIHNQIPEPNRREDNSTYWVQDFNRDHYDQMLFSTTPGVVSMANYYLEQSSGRYTVDGTVTDWVRINANESDYGRPEPGQTSGDSNTVYRIIRDAISQWVADQRAAGKTPQQIRDYLSQFDVWDRYDHDGDGNFDEPDGYIDHFQIIHAGEGEEAGGGAQGADAIWSHRWYANWPGIGVVGPSPDALLGGYEFPGTNIWVGDYTIEPENGGVGVFAHEFGHDLGLPDEYDTSYLGEASSAFWTLMSAGSWLGEDKDSIGTKPGHMNAWDKLMLGWLNYDVAISGHRSSHRLGPAEYNTKAAQALITVLPKKQVTTEINAPYSGSWEWWSGSGDNLDNTLTRHVDLSAVDSASLQAYLWYDIEDGWDYAYVQASDNNGSTWTNLEGNVTTNDDPNGQNLGNGITGNSGGWVLANFDLSQFAGKDILLRFRYVTDGAVQGKGMTVDEIKIIGDGNIIFTDGAEEGDNGWDANGFSRIQGSITRSYNHYYIAEYRRYLGYDTALKTGPYNFPDPSRNWVEHYPYQDGLLISYWDTSFNDNNVGQHPGQGLILPIDAHPEPLLRKDGTPWRTRVQVYDATFGLQRTDPIALSYLDSSGRLVRVKYPSLPAARTFNDLNTYWYASKPDAGVKVPKTGTVIQVVGTSNHGNFMQVQVKPARR